MKEACPRCRDKGEDRHGDNLCVYPDGGKHCFKCGYHEFPDGTSEVKEQEKKRLSIDVSQIKQYSIRSLTHRPIRKEVCERFSVRVSVREEDGEVDTIYYPYYVGDDIVSYKVRKLPKEFYAAGEQGKAGLFGVQSIRKTGKLLVITEGEDDCLAAYQMLLDLGKNYNVTSLPNGANSDGVVDRAIKRSIDLLKEFENIVLCMDMDEPGQATAKALANFLSPFTKVRIMSLPVKDASDMLVAGKGDEFWECLCKATEFKAEGVVSGTDIKYEDLFKPMQEGYSLPYPLLQRKIHGLRKGELVTLTAGSGIGKSTLAREIAYHLVKEHNLSVANIFLEEQYLKTALSYIAIDHNVPLPLLRVNPSLISEEDKRRSFDELILGGKNHFFNHFGSLDSDDLIDRLRYFVYAENVDFILLDHLSLIISGQEGGNERRSIDLLMTKLAAFVNETNVGVIAVCHLKRPSSGSYTEGKEVSLSDLRGSAALEQLSWCVIGMERDQQSEEQSDFSTIRVLKNREHGHLGVADSLFFNAETGRLLANSSEDSM